MRRADVPAAAESGGAASPAGHRLLRAAPALPLIAVAATCPSRRPSATAELADGVAAVGTVAVREARVGKPEAGTRGLASNQARRLSDECGNEAQQDAAAGEASRERASQGVKARAIHRKYSRA